MLDMSIELKLAYDYKEEVKELFEEYTNILIESDKEFAKYLKIQNYDSEVNHLEDKYGLPNGRLYIATVDNKVAGGVALRPLDENSCELKRLYVRPEFRGCHLGNKLVNQIISDAKDIGYHYILLDTLPFLQSAIYLYKKFGFYEIEKYNDSPIESSIFMRLDLV